MLAFFYFDKEAIVEFLADIVKYIVLGAIALVALTLLSFYLASKLPPDNPLYRLMNALSQRLAVTTGLFIITPPIELIPVFDALYDIGAAAFLGWYWWRFIHEELLTSHRPAPKTTMVVDIDPPASPREPGSDYRS